jgi:hypothetical protein
MTAGNVRRVKLEHNQPPHTGAAWSGTCRAGEEEENGRAGGGSEAGRDRDRGSVGGGGWRLACSGTGEESASQLLVKEEEEKEEEEEEEEEEGQGSRVLTSLVSTCSL